MEPPGAPYSSLDESSLRALLEETLDLDQRRLIRSALREVRRREIQDMEATLLSKRHRPSRRCTQEDKEDKENQHTPRSSNALHLLTQKVQEIRDLEELSTMLRSAPEYEERRIIRAAIRSIREEQQQEDQGPGIRSIREEQQPEEQGPCIRSIREEQQEELGLCIREEHGHVRRRRAEEEPRPEGGALEPESTSTPHRPDSYKTGSRSGMMLVFGPQLKDEGPQPLLIQASREALPTGASDLNQEPLPSGASDLNQEPLPSGASDLNQEPLPSGASDLNQEPLPSGASDLNQEPLPSGASDLNQEPLPSGALEPCASMCSDEKVPTDSEGESRASALRAPALRAPALQDQTDGAMISTKDSLRGRLDQKITVNNSLSSRKHKDTEQEDRPLTAAAQCDADMKTFLTIEIKENRSTAQGPPRNPEGPPRNPEGPRLHSSHRAELTLGLRASPFRISSSLTAPSVTMESESPSQLILAPPSQLVLAPPSVGGPTDLSNGGLPKAEERSSKVTPEFLAAIDEEETLDQMLDQSKDFEERRLIRAAMRDLRKRKRDQREKEREVRLQEQRQQRDQRDQRGHRDQRDQRTASRPGTEEVVIKKLEKSADGSTLSQVTKTNTFSQSDGSRSTLSTVTSYVHKTDRGTVQSKSYSFSSSTSSSNTKVGSVFEREDSSVSRSSVVAAEKKKKEVQRSQTMTSSSLQARKALMERLDKDSSGGPAVVKINRVQRSTSFGVPNANTIKQMLLDWCRAKTRGYQHVEIQNFSSSWSSGMAFCALVHHFFPEAFDYSVLQPSERRHNFELAFSTAERTVDCPQLLDVEDMVKLREPDWKCVYTYLQEFYRGLVTKGLVRTRANAS